MENKPELDLGRIQTYPKTGQEQLTFDNKQLGFSVLDFWRWSTSDILSNTIRGGFAEFIVATALNLDLTVLRDEWNAYDLRTTEGIKIEVKCSAYIQTWYQRVLSKILFSTKPALYWDSITAEFGTTKQRNADVYVFCLLHHSNQETIDPLNMDQWEFYVLATEELNNYERSQHSITLKSLQRLTQAVPYDKVKESVMEKHKLNVK
jgi:hypothetical protein